MLNWLDSSEHKQHCLSPQPRVDLSCALWWAQTIFLCFALGAVIVFVSYWKVRSLLSTIRNYYSCGNIVVKGHERELITESTSGQESETRKSYCPFGCQGACACPILESYETGLRNPTSERRAERILAFFLMNPECLKEIIVEDSSIADILDVRLNEIVARRKDDTLHSSSSFKYSL